MVAPLSCAVALVWAAAAARVECWDGRILEGGLGGATQDRKLLVGDQAIPIEQVLRVAWAQGTEAPQRPSGAVEVQLVCRMRLIARVVAYDRRRLALDWLGQRREVRAEEVDRIVVRGDVPPVVLPPDRDGVIVRRRGQVEAITGCVEAIGEDGVRVTPQEGEPCTVPWDEVALVEFAGRPQAPSVRGWYANLVSRGGDLVVGLLRRFEADVVELDAPGLGVVQFPIAAIRRIEFIEIPRAWWGRWIVCGRRRAWDCDETLRPERPISGAYDRVDFVERLETGGWLVASRLRDMVLQLDSGGRATIWSHPADSALAVRRLPDGTTLFLTRGGLVRIDAEGRTRWSVERQRMHSVVVLEDGRIVAGTDSAMVPVAEDGSVGAEVALREMSPMRLKAAGADRILVVDRDKVTLVNLAGSVLARIGELSGVLDAEALPNGLVGVLQSDGSEGWCLVEYDWGARRVRVHPLRLVQDTPAWISSY